MRSVQVFTDTTVVNIIMNRINSVMTVDSILETKGGYIVANADSLYYVLHTFYPSIHERNNLCSKERYLICDGSTDLLYFSDEEPKKFSISLPQCTNLAIVKLTLPFMDIARKLNQEALKIYDPWETDAVAGSNGEICVGTKHIYPDSRSLYDRSFNKLD